jgi:mono/diheme cytochrome c family protein
MRRRMTTIRLATTLAVAALSLGAAACGTRNVELPKNEQSAGVKNGAELFAERCSGCHTMNIVGAQGSKPTNDVGGGERTNGPNFNVRKESHDDVLFAIRNGGFSGAIMPANIVVGSDAENVAEFVSKYAGRGGSDVTEQQSPNNESGASGGTSLPGD